MNDDRNFESKKQWLLELLNLGMPTLVIQFMLDVSASTVGVYIIKLREGNGWEGKIIPLDTAKPQMLKLYADIKFRQSELTDGKFVEKLCKVLAEVLEEEKIIQIIRNALPSIICFRKIRFHNSIQQAYRNLLEDIWGYEAKFLEIYLWKKYLKEIADLQVEVPQSKQFIWEGRHFVYDDIIQKYADEIREKRIGPIATSSIVKIIDEIIDGIVMPQKDIVSAYYGLKAKPKSLKEIAISYGKTSECIRQIKEKGLHKIKRNLLKNFCYINDAWEEKNKLKQDHKEEIHKIQQKILDIDTRYKQLLSDSGNPELRELGESIDSDYKKNPFLLKNIQDIEMSVRVYNCLRSADITYIWELLVYIHNVTDLCRFRNFGKKSVPEIESILAKENLKFGMVFSTADIAYFETMTPKK